MIRVEFPTDNSFLKILQERVDAKLGTADRNKKGGWKMIRKTAIIMATFIASYVYLVFFAQGILPALAAAFVLAQAITMIGFNIMHDGGHKSYSTSNRLNHIMAHGIDLIGGSAYLWNYQHNIVHHRYTNIEGVDEDLGHSAALRFSPSQKHHAWHRYQHIYGWFLYPLLTILWSITDFIQFFGRQIGNHKINAPTATDIITFLVMKIVYFGYAFVIPMLYHDWWVVVLFYLGIHALLGFTMAVVFQLAHVTDEVDTYLPSEDMNIPLEWAQHQLRTTADFATTNPFATWYMGGLNFQVEHHLFQHISHVHYPTIQPIVRDTCREFGIEYHEFPTFWGALRAHYRVLRKLGQDKVAPNPVPALSNTATV